MLEYITVTATRMPRNIEDIAGSVTVITDDEIMHQVSDDLDDLVRYQPGISMDTAGRGGNQGFIIRGIGGNRVLTLVDGIRSNDIYDAVTAGYGRDVYEVDDLKAVEIIRGPASVLYGADAMGGAVLLQTKNPADYLEEDDASYLAARASYTGANESYKAGLTAAARSGILGGMLQYTRREFQERDVQGAGEQNPLDGHSDNLLIKAVLIPHEDHRLTLTFDTVREDVDSVLNTDLSMSVTSSTGADETERNRVSLNHFWFTGTAFADHLETDLYWQETDALQHSEQRRTSYSFINPFDFSTYGGTEADRISDFELNQDITGLGLMLSKGVPTGGIEHSVVYGFNLDQTDTTRPRDRCETQISTGDTNCGISEFPFAEPEVFPNKTFPDTETTRTGIYWQDEMAFGDSGLSIIPGVRYDRYEMDTTVDGLLDVSEFGFDVVSVEEDEMSFNLGMIYDLTDTIALSAQYAEGFRPPNYDEANQAFINRGFGYATVPNPDLEPETSRGIEVGLKANFERVYMSLAFYDNRYRNFISSEFIGMQDGISLFQDSNIGRAHIYGVEATTMWQLTNHWQVRGSLAYSRGNDQEADVPLDSIDPVSGILGLRYRGMDDRWGLETLLTLAGSKDRVSAGDRITADSYAVLDLVGHININDKASLRAGVFNLLDQQYARWANIQGFAATDTEAIARAQQPGTNFRINLEYRF